MTVKDKPGRVTTKKIIKPAAKVRFLASATVPTNNAANAT